MFSLIRRVIRRWWEGLRLCSTSPPRSHLPQRYCDCLLLLQRTPGNFRHIVQLSTAGKCRRLLVRLISLDLKQGKLSKQTNSTSLWLGQISCGAPEASSFPLQPPSQKIRVLLMASAVRAEDQVVKGMFNHRIFLQRFNYLQKLVPKKIPFKNINGINTICF